MFKNRTMMSGIGTGLIVGAIFLQVMLVGRDAAKASTPPGTVKPDELSQQQLKEVASRYYQVFDKTEKVYTQAELDAKVKEAAASQSNAGQAPASAASSGERKKIAVYISQGLVASQVADLLYRSGVIADRNAFEKLLADKQISNKIQIGYHVFDGITDPQQVLATLTNAQ